MAKRSKTYRSAKEKIENKDYTLEEAVAILKEFKSARFDESIDISIRLNVDPKYPEQMVRGTVALPHGTGKQIRVLAIASGEKQKEAENAGADFVGGEDMVERIEKEGWFDYDLIVTTPDMMKHVGKLGKILGPRGLMPSPKAGTVTFNIQQCVDEIKKGRVEFRVDKTGIINSSLGKMSFDTPKIIENVSDFITSVLKAKPVSLKGKYVCSVFISSTMSPSIKLTIQEFE
ncbi:MAG: 50S ribosomal protein L1 [Candidatus Aminicenantes bacterium]|nr:50S ribosomal protein L1 [Candidatus Aminicenantes bacterium]